MADQFRPRDWVLETRLRPYAIGLDYVFSVLLLQVRANMITITIPLLETSSLVDSSCEHTPCFVVCSLRYFLL